MRGPRVETRGCFLSSLMRLIPGAPLISGLNPELFSVALSGLQEQARVAGGGFLPRLVSPAAGGGFLPRLVSPAGGGGRRRRPGVDLNPAILGKGCRFVQPHSGLGRWGCPESRVHCLRGRPPVRPGTRSRAGAAPGTCPRSAPGFSNAAAVRWRPEAALTGAPPRTLFIPGHSFHNTRDMTCSLSGRNSKERL